MEIQRKSNNGLANTPGGTTLALTTDQTTTAVLIYTGWSGGNLIIPSGSSITSLTFYGCDTPNGTPVPVYDNTKATPVATVITGATAPGIVPIPDECFGVPYLFIKADAAGSVVFVGKG